jgi:serine/threonine-protein kinase
VTPTLPTIGETLGGRYELLDTLGEGGMSVVFRARDQVSNSDVALKLLTPRYLGRPEREQRLLDEAKYLEQLRGTAGIITLLDHGRFAEHHDWPYLAIQLLDGRALNWLLIKHELGPVGIRELALGLASALASCHAAGIVHRDLTPSNVSVTLDPIRVQLFDFSHASSVSSGATGPQIGPQIDPGDSERLTGIFDVPGTSGYMGPEQASSVAADPKMDVFAYGVLLYEIITGRNPYPKVSHAEFIELQRSGSLEPPRLASWVYKVNPKWSDLIHDCTLAEPSERPTMAALVQAIEAIDPSEPLTPPADEIDDDQTQRMDARQVERLQGELRGTSEPEPEFKPAPKPEPSGVAAIGAWDQPAAPPVNAWGPPPTGIVDSPAPSPSPAPLREPAFARTEPEQQPASTHAAPELQPAFARAEPELQPAFARADAKPIAMPPMPDPAAIDDDAAPSRSRPRRWVPVLLLLGAAGVIGLAAWSATGPKRGGPTHDHLVDPVSAPAPEHLQGPALDSEVAETGGSQLGEIVPELPPLIEPKPAVTPVGKPKPEAKPPECQDPQGAAEAAKAKRDWSAVIRHTAKPRCWASNQIRLRLRVEALAQAKRFDECLELANTSDDPELTRWVKFCTKNL